MTFVFFHMPNFYCSCMTCVNKKFHAPLFSKTNMPVTSRRRSTKPRSKASAKSGSAKSSSKRSSRRSASIRVMHKGHEHAMCSRDAHEHGMHCCQRDGWLPSPESGHCIRENGPTYERLGMHHDGDVYMQMEDGQWIVQRDGKLYPVCSEEAREAGLHCCTQPGWIPSPESNHCMMIGGPTYDRLGMQQAGNRFFVQSDNAVIRDQQEKMMADKTYMMGTPSGTPLVSATMGTSIAKPTATLSEKPAIMPQFTSMNAEQIAKVRKQQAEEQKARDLARSFAASVNVSKQEEARDEPPAYSPEYFQF